MSSWFLKNLGDPLLADNDLQEIKSLFTAAHATAGNPDEMAVFLRHESEGKIHCELILYLSPLLQTLAVELEAKPCRPPAISGLSLWAGSKQAWQLLFSE